MKKLLTFTIVFTLLLFVIPTKSICQAIVANHTFVDKYVDIPQQYIDLVKNKWLSYAGESHSEAIRYGMELLELEDSKFSVNITEDGIPEEATSGHLRVSRATWGDLNSSSGWIYSCGEEDWFTSETAISRTLAGLTYCNENGYPLDYFAFGWCYDGTYPGVEGSYDPVYYTRWGGATVGSIDGETCWGLDSGDSLLTGNRISMQTYIDATKDYIKLCNDNDYPTKVLFTTGPMDDNFMDGLNEDEVGYQQYLKWEYIRNYVATTNYTLFDYADILSYNDAGELATTTWTDNNNEVQTFPIIHPDNMGGDYIAHIGTVGALRLAKAMWVLLAMEEGWDSGLITTTEELRISADKLLAYPNPASGNIVFEVPGSETNYLVEIYSIAGIPVFSNKFKSAGSKIELTNLELVSGTYLAKIKGDGQYLTAKFCITE